MENAASRWFRWWSGASLQRATRVYARLLRGAHGAHVGTRWALLVTVVAGCASGTMQTDTVDAGGGGDGPASIDARVPVDGQARPDGNAPADATTVPPDGCVLGTAESCSECGVACPGLGQSAALVECQSGGVCTFACSGEHYDVDGSEADGCEETDTPTGNHTLATATYLGSLPCNDGSSNPNASGKLPSDARSHENPAVTGLVESVGAAPDYYRIQADGGLCENNVVLTLSASGTGSLDCYKLTVDTDKSTFSCITNAAGACTIDQSSLGQYSDDTEIDLKVEKICAATMSGVVTYSVTGHL